ncbi:MAG: YbjQ family protein [Firmicutes bacterium]|nr:YbjQ family protein [Bacillota bacterium]
MILVNTDYISGKKLETISLVKGGIVQSAHIGKDFTASFKTIVGGELKAYTKMMDEARALATERMVAEARALGADGIINIRFVSSSVMQGAAEIIVYGTAVKFINE